MATILDSDNANSSQEQAVSIGKTAASSSADRLRVKIAAPYNIYYDDFAESVSAENDTGPFDVLKGHHNFMSLLATGEIIVKDSKGDQAFKIARGIMHVQSDSVKVFLDV